MGPRNRDPGQRGHPGKRELGIPRDKVVVVPFGIDVELHAHVIASGPRSD